MARRKKLRKPTPKELGINKEQKQKMPEEKLERLVNYQEKEIEQLKSVLNEVDSSMNKEEPKVLTRMRLSCCWGDNLNEKELNEVVDYINLLQQKVNQLETNRDEAIEYIKEHIKYECDNAFNGMKFYSYHLYDFSNKKLLSILERGKE